MGYPMQLALRYLGAKKRTFVSVGTAFAILGVTLGVAALAIVMSVTGGFQEQFREKVLGVNAHVLVLKYSIDFREYRDIMKKAATARGVIGVAPFIINPMMVTHGSRTATGVLLKGVDPVAMQTVLDLPKHIVEPEIPKEMPEPARSTLVSKTLDGLRRAGAKPPERSAPDYHDFFPVSPPSPSTPAPTDSSHTGGGSGAGAPTGSVHKPAVNDEDEEVLVLGSDGDGRAHARSTLEEAIAKSIADHDKAAAVASAAPSPATSPDLGAPAAQAPVGKGAPVGNIAPSGGYQSVLPADDAALPDSIDPDPCGNAKAVASLPGVIIGKTLGKQLGVGLGDCLQITSPTIGMSFGTSGARPPIAKQFRVIAIFEAGFDQYDSKLVYTDLYEAQAFYDQGDSVTGVEMKVDDIDHARAIATDIDHLLANGLYHTMDWKELNHGLFTALFIQQLGMSFVLGLIIVVAAFTVVATLIMVVLDKKKEIAILKALGARDGAVLRIFLYQGAIIGTIGTAAGLAVGYVGCKLLVIYGFPLDPKVYFISKLPVNLRPTEFIITGVVAIVVCLTATIFPALYASELRPADGLRAE
jgi:lipoprotein-releasing system permease protein